MECYNRVLENRLVVRIGVVSIHYFRWNKFLAYFRAGCSWFRKQNTIGTPDLCF